MLLSSCVTISCSCGWFVWFMLDIVVHIQVDDVSKVSSQLIWWWWGICVWWSVWRRLFLDCKWCDALDAKHIRTPSCLVVLWCKSGLMSCQFLSFKMIKIYWSTSFMFSDGLFLLVVMKLCGWMVKLLVCRFHLGKIFSYNSEKHNKSWVVWEWLKTLVITGVIERLGRAWL